MGHEFLRAAAIIVGAAVLVDVIATVGFLTIATYVDNRERI